MTRLPTLAGYLWVLRSGAIVIALCTAIGGLTGWWWQAQTPVPYRASAAVQLPDIPVYVDLSPGGNSPRTATIDTAAQLVYSRPVLRRVSAATGTPVPAVHDGLTVSAYPLSRVLIVGFHAPTAGQAAVGAVAAARATVEQRTKVLAGAQLQDARKLYGKLRELRSQAARRASQFPTVSRRINTQVDHLIEVLNDRSAPEGRLVVDASSAKRIDAQPEVPITTGLVAGFSVGVGWWVWSRRPTQRLAFGVAA